MWLVWMWLVCVCVVGVCGWFGECVSAYFCCLWHLETVLFFSASLKNEQVQKATTFKHEQFQDATKVDMRIFKIVFGCS